MDKKEQFKKFASLHPGLIKHIKNGSMNWQKFYEIYDIYGETESVWNEYLNDPIVEATTENRTETTTDSTSTSSTESGNSTFDTITEKLGGLNMDKIQEHIGTAQKALNIVSELTTKTPAAVTPSGPSSPRPINKFFED